MAVRTPDITGPEKGTANGFVVKFNTTTRVIITAGSYEVDGTLFTLAADVTHDMTSLIAAFQHHYIYLDKSASISNPTSPVFIDSITEPVRDITRNGWYHPTNTQDRLVGEMPTAAGFSTGTITESISTQSGDDVILEIEGLLLPFLALNMDPADVWQDPIPKLGLPFLPDGINGSILTPVNANRLRFRLSNTDANANVSVYVGASEISPLGGGLTNTHFVEVGFNRRIAIGWINLGDSRNVRLSGANANDNALALLCLGYKYKRTA